jgi:hypothetical protein
VPLPQFADRSSATMTHSALMTVEILTFNDRTCFIARSTWFSTQVPFHHWHPKCRHGKRAREFGSWPGHGNRMRCAVCTKLEVGDRESVGEAIYERPLAAVNI